MTCPHRTRALTIPCSLCSAIVVTRIPPAPYATVISMTTWHGARRVLGRNDWWARARSVARTWAT